MIFVKIWLLICLVNGIEFCGEPKICICSMEEISCTGRGVYSLPVFNSKIRTRTKTIILDKTSIDKLDQNELKLFTQLMLIVLKKNVFLCPKQNIHITQFDKINCYSNSSLEWEVIEINGFTAMDTTEIIGMITEHGVTGGLTIDRHNLKLDTPHIVLVCIASILLIVICSSVTYLLIKRLIKRRAKRGVIYIPMTDVLPQSEI